MDRDILYQLFRALRESFEFSKGLLEPGVIQAQSVKLIKPGIEVPVQGEQVLPRWAVLYEK